MDLFVHVFFGVFGVVVVAQEQVAVQVAADPLPVAVAVLLAFEEAFSAVAPGLVDDCAQVHVDVLVGAVVPGVGQGGGFAVSVVAEGVVSFGDAIQDPHGRCSFLQVVRARRASAAACRGLEYSGLESQLLMLLSMGAWRSLA